MADEIFLGSKTYVSSKRAAKECGYAQDYIGQLARGGVIDAQRVGGLWYVAMDSLEAYKRNADSFAPKQPLSAVPADPDTIVSFDGKDYVSAARAAKLTGYNPDYIGQLARGGKILSRQVGNRWYVERSGLLAHKTQKDALLAAVQAESVGLARPDAQTSGASRKELVENMPYLNYFREDDHLLPVLTKPERIAEEQDTVIEQRGLARPTPVPIRVLRSAPILSSSKRTHALRKNPPAHGLTMRTAAKSVAALTVVIVISYGMLSIKKGSVYSILDTVEAPTQTEMLAGAAYAIEAAGDLLERIVSPELRYTRER